jgi:pimeloyl-ACP methyl ester carboxylesterase
MTGQQLWIPTADTRLNAYDTPGGDPPLLFINGGFGTTRDWNPVVTEQGHQHGDRRHRQGRRRQAALGSMIF